MSRICSRSSAGLTLIEVIASMALLTTLLVGIVCAEGRHARQIRAAKERIGLVHQVDQLLSQWLKTDKVIPREATGLLPGSDQYVWQTHLLSDSANFDLQVEAVRLEVRPRTDLNSQRSLLTIDLAVPAAPPAPSEE